MNIYLKELEVDDDIRYYNLLKELSNYDAYAKPVPKEFDYSMYDFFKNIRVKMKNEGKVSTYYVMDGDIPVGYATINHKADLTKPGGHFGLCLKKSYQNKGLGSIVSSLLFDIAYTNLGIKEAIFTSKNENIQSQKSVLKTGAELVSIHDGYRFYIIDLEKVCKKNKKI